MDVFFKYGEEVENEADSVEFHTYGVARAASEAQFHIWLTGEPYVTWFQGISQEDYLTCDLDARDLAAEARERSIAKNIALAVARKKRSRAAYKAPTLADIWFPEV